MVKFSGGRVKGKFKFSVDQMPNFVCIHVNIGLYTNGIVKRPKQKVNTIDE